MTKRISQVLNIVIATAIGVFIGHGIYVYWDFRSHPGLYAMSSAPWYTSILVYGGFTVAVIVICLGIKFALRKRIS